METIIKTSKITVCFETGYTDKYNNKSYNLEFENKDKGLFTTNKKDFDVGTNFTYGITEVENKTAGKKNYFKITRPKPVEGGKKPGTNSYTPAYDQDTQKRIIRMTVISTSTLAFAHLNSLPGMNLEWIPRISAIIPRFEEWLMALGSTEGMVEKEKAISAQSSLKSAVDSVTESSISKSFIVEDPIKIILSMATKYYNYIMTGVV